MTTAATFTLTTFLFFLSVYGLSNAIAVLKIGSYFFGRGHCTDKDCAAVDHPKDGRRGLGNVPYFGDLLYCPPCISFWWGMVTSRLLISPASLVCTTAVASTVIDGLAACAVSYILHVVMEKVGQGVESL
jgi:hypothetical protein